MASALKKRLDKAEQQVLRETVLRPPDEIIPFLRHEREATTSDEKRLLAEWIDTVFLASKRSVITFPEAMDALPMSFRLKVIEELKKLLKKNDRNISN